MLGDDHLAILLLQEAANVKFAIVHFTGGAAAMTALLGGHTDVQFGNVGDFVTRVKDGSVRVLAVMDKERNKFLPDVPTVEESIGTRLISSSSRGVAAPRASRMTSTDTSPMHGARPWRTRGYSRRWPTLA